MMQIPTYGQLQLMAKKIIFFKQLKKATRNTDAQFPILRS